MTNKVAFDDRAHSILADLIDGSEDYLIRRKKCVSHAANDQLCHDYIKSCASMMFGAQWYVAGDEMAGTEIFISRLRGARGNRCPARRSTDCANQLLAFPQIYFPNYIMILRMSYLAELAKLTDKTSVVFNGTMKLASANLPGVRSDVRRHLRRLGATFDYSIVDDATITRKNERFTRAILPMLLDNTDKPGG